MALLIAIILWLIFVVLTLLCLTIILPIVVKVHLTTVPRFAYQVEMHALAGLGPFFTVADGPRHASIDALDARPRPKAVNAKQRGMLLRERGHGAVVQALPIFIGDIVHRVRLLKLHIDADYGLGDPAETGRLCGVLIPLQHAGRMPEYVSLDLRPDFTKRGMNGSLTVWVRVTIAALLIPIMRFAWRAYGPNR